jgi:hypothetical protein
MLPLKTKRRDMRRDMLTALAAGKYDGAVFNRRILRDAAVGINASNCVLFKVWKPR